MCDDAILFSDRWDKDWAGPKFFPVHFWHCDSHGFVDHQSDERLRKDEVEKVLRAESTSYDFHGIHVSTAEPLPSRDTGLVQPGPNLRVDNVPWLHQVLATDDTLLFCRLREENPARTRFDVIRCDHDPVTITIVVGRNLAFCDVAAIPPLLHLPMRRNLPQPLDAGVLVRRIRLEPPQFLFRYRSVHCHGPPGGHSPSDARSRRTSSRIGRRSCRSISSRSFPASGPMERCATSKRLHLRRTRGILPIGGGKPDRLLRQDRRAPMREGPRDGLRQSCPVEFEAAREVVEVEEVLDTTVAVPEHDDHIERAVALPEQIQVSRRPVRLIGPDSKKHRTLENETTSHAGSIQPVQEAFETEAGQDDLVFVAALPGSGQEPRHHGGTKVPSFLPHTIASR